MNNDQDTSVDSKELGENERMGRKFWVLFPDWQFRIVDPKFQFTIYAYFGGLACLTIGLVAFWTKDITNFVVSSDFMYFVLSVVSFFVLFAAILSHKLIGPIYNLKHHLRNIKEGRTSEHIKFRKDDFFLDLAEEFNSLLDFFTNKKR